MQEWGHLVIHQAQNPLPQQWPGMGAWGETRTKYVCSDNSCSQFGGSISWIRCLWSPQDVPEALAVSWGKELCGCAACHAFGLFLEWFLSVASLCSREAQASVPGDHPHASPVADCWGTFVHFMLWVLLLEGYFVCLLVLFLLEVGFIMSSGPTSGLWSGIEPLPGLLLIFLLTGEKC